MSLTPRKRSSLLSARMWSARDGEGREKCVLSISVESCDFKVKLLKQFGRYFLIWFSKSFLLVINSLINTSKFLWASLLGKILIHESSSQAYTQFSLGIQELKKKILCKWLYMKRQSFPSSFSYKCILCMAGSEPLSCNKILAWGIGCLIQGIHLFLSYLFSNIYTIK